MAKSLDRSSIIEKNGIGILCCSENCLTRNSQRLYFGQDKQPWLLGFFQPEVYIGKIKHPTCQVRWKYHLYKHIQNAAVNWHPHLVQFSCWRFSPHQVLPLANYAGWRVYVLKANCHVSNSFLKKTLNGPNFRMHQGQNFLNDFTSILHETRK